MNPVSAISQFNQLQRNIPKAPAVTQTYWEAPLPPELRTQSVLGQIADMLLNITYVVVGVAAVLAAALPVLLAASCWWLLTREWPLALGDRERKTAPVDRRPPVKEHRVAKVKVLGRMYDPRGLEVEDTLGPLRPGEEPF